jgi:signal transduction histidine kinase
MRIAPTVSIRFKLTAIMVATSIIVLLLASAVYLITDVVSQRNDLVEDVSTVAEIIASGTGQDLVRKDQKAAEAHLGNLQSDPHVISAFVVTAHDEIFASYIRSDPDGNPEADEDWIQSVLKAHPELLASDGNHRFSGDALDLTRKIVVDGETIGTLWIRSDLAVLRARIESYGDVGGIVLLSLSLLAFILSAMFQRRLSDPIRSLTAVMMKIATDGDYSVQAEPRKSKDEIGTLISGFNQMLRHIHAQSIQLAQHSDFLETEVEKRSQANIELKQAKDSAEAANNAKSDFLAKMSHEIRTPMNGVLGMNELLLQTELTETQRDLATTVRKSGETLLDLISSILDFSKIEAGKLVLEEVEFDLWMLIDEAVGMFAEEAYKKDLELACEIGSEVPRPRRERLWSAPGARSTMKTKQRFRSRSRTPALASRLKLGNASSSFSTRKTDRHRGGTVARAWVWRSRSSSLKPWAAKSVSTAKKAAGLPSGSGFKWRTSSDSRPRPGAPTTCNSEDFMFWSSTTARRTARS